MRAVLGTDDTPVDVETSVDAIDVVGDRVMMEWRVRGRFSNACIVDDDLLVEPTGELVECSGVLVARFRGCQVVGLRCYFDSRVLLEQVLALAYARSAAPALRIRRRRLGVVRRAAP